MKKFKYYDGQDTSDVMKAIEPYLDPYVASLAEYLYDGDFYGAHPEDRAWQYELAGKALDWVLEVGGKDAAR